MEALQSQVNKAIIYSSPGTTETEVITLPTPSPGYGEVLVRILFSGVCHTDYSFCTNAWNSQAPVPRGQIGGHEGIGHVVAVGPGVTHPAIGFNVGVNYVASACLSCRYCLLGKDANCLAAGLSGANRPGTFQQYCIASAHCTTVIPQDIPMSVLPSLAPLMCAGVTVYTGLKSGNLRPGDWVAVSGAGGGLGHLGVQYAKAMGYRVVALDVANKAALCREAGAEHFVDVTTFSDDEELCRRVTSLTDGGARLTLACSSSNRAYAQAINYLDVAGTLLCLGVPEGDPQPIQTASVARIVSRQLRIVGSKIGTRQDMNECLGMAIRGAVKPHYQLRQMDSLTQVFHEMESGSITGRIVIDMR